MRIDQCLSRMSASRFRVDDLTPLVYRTRDGGRSWKLITSGLAPSATVNVVREDQKVKGLLFAGTERDVYVSFDDGDACQLRRVIRSEGTSRAWINGRPATLTQLQSLATLLIEIHGQHEHQALLDKSSRCALGCGLKVSPAQASGANAAISATATTGASTASKASFSAFSRAARSDSTGYLP